MGHKGKLKNPVPYWASGCGCPEILDFLGCFATSLDTLLLTFGTVCRSCVQGQDVEEVSFFMDQHDPKCQ